MEIRFLEKTSDRTFLIQLDFTGYCYPGESKEIHIFGYTRKQYLEISNQILDSYIHSVNLKRIHWWMSQQDNLRKPCVIYRTYVIKD